MSDSEINADIIGQLVDKGLVDKSVLDKIIANSGPISPEQIIQAESSGNPNAVSPKGATGLMQLMPATAAEEAKKLHMDSYDLKNPEDNKKLGTAYFKEQMQKYGDPSLALAAYNAGPGTVDRAIAAHGPTYEAIATALPEETRNYVAKITGTPTPEATPPPMAAPAPTYQDTPAPTPQPTVAPTPEPTIPQVTPTAAVMPVPGQEAAPTVAPTPADQMPLPETPVVGPTQPQAAPPPVDPQLALAAASESSQQGDATGTLAGLAGVQPVQDPSQAYAAATAAETAGKIGEDKAKVIGAQQTAAQYAAQAQEISAQGADYATKRQKAEEATQIDLDRYRQKVIAFGNAAVDPDRIFKGKSTFSTILLGAGAALQAAAGNTQAATKIIDDAIQKDVDLQKANFALKKQDVENETSLMAANHKQLESIDAAQTQTEAQMRARTVATLNQIAANQTSEVAKSNILTVAGDQKQKMLEQEAKFEKLRGESNALAALQTPSAGFDKAESALASLPMKGAGKFVVQQDGKPIGMALEPNKMNIVIQTRSVINENLKALRDLYKGSTTGIPLDPTKADLAKTYIARIKENLANAQKNGSRMAKLLQTSFDEQMPDDLMSAGGGALGRLAKGLFVQTGLASDPMAKIDAFQKETDDQFLVDAQNLVKNPTPAFQRQLAVLMGRKGTLPGDKVLP